MRGNTDQNNSEYGHFLRSVDYKLQFEIFEKMLVSLLYWFAARQQTSLLGRQKFDFLNQN